MSAKVPFERHPIIQRDLDRILLAPLPWERFAGRTVLVAGAAGFIGAYVVDTLLRLNEGHTQEPVQILALARQAHALRSRFPGEKMRDDLRFLVQDACIPVQLDMPVDFVIHAASPGTPRAFGRDPIGTFAANVFATRELLELKPRDAFLFFSSGEVYGLGNDQIIPTHENAYGLLDPTQVRSCYGESKRAGETLCACYAAQEGVHTTMARIFHTYGPGMPLGDGRTFSDFVQDALLGRDIEMRSEGKASRAFCYLADTVEACFTILLKGATATAYNVGNDRAELTVLELAQLIAGLDPARRLRVRRAAIPDASDTYLPSPIQRGCPDVSRLRMLGWEPRVGPHEGFKRTLDSFC